MAAEDYHADFYDPPDSNSEDDSHLTHHPTCPHYSERFSERCICEDILADLRAGSALSSGEEKHR